MKKPIIRFNGFTEDWEQRKLGEYCDMFNGDRSNKYPNAQDMAPEGIPFINAGDLENGRVNLETANKISRKKYDDLGGAKLQLGDIVYCLRGTLGKNAYIDNFEEGTVASSLVAIRPKNINGRYLFHILNSDIEYRQRVVHDEGAAQPNLSAKNVAGFNIPIPDIDEQDKLASYFDGLDTLITLHQWKCSKLKDSKIIVWEQRKLGEICDSFEYGLNAAAKEYDGENKYIRITDIDDSSHEFVQEEITSPDIDLANAENYRLEYGDVLFARTGASVGKTYIYKESDGLVYYAGFLIRGRVKDEFSPEFVFQNTLTDEYVKFIRITSQRSGQPGVNAQEYASYEISTPKFDEQKKIGEFFSNLDQFITLHQCKPNILTGLKNFVWEQRKVTDLGEIYIGLVTTMTAHYTDHGALLIRNSDIKDGKFEFDTDPIYLDDKFAKANKSRMHKVGDVITVHTGDVGTSAVVTENEANSIGFATIVTRPNKEILDSYYLSTFLNTDKHKNWAVQMSTGDGRTNYNLREYTELIVPVPSISEQKKIAEYIIALNTLITLHQRKEKVAEKAFKYIKIRLIMVKETKDMAELEALIEQKLIDQLAYGDSQWNYRQDLKTEADLWNNFRYILEQNNKDRLNGEPLSDAEFDQVKNQLQFSSFYKAGEWLVGENGKVMVHVQRGTEKMHLVVMNHEHIAGGSSVYEVINQYQALDTDENSTAPARDRRFDVTLLINGLPMIHIELKNKQHPYMDGFRQIKKYIGEGKFTGIFSAVQMFVVSNGVDTKYFAAASDRELNEKFLSGWVDNNNEPVTDYLDFAGAVLRIPQAHEMIARYTVLDEDAKRLIILRPYQIHAIEAIREASKSGKSGYVWHTTGDCAILMTG